MLTSVRTLVVDINLHNVFLVVYTSLNIVMSHVMGT